MFHERGFVTAQSAAENRVSRCQRQQFAPQIPHVLHVSPSENRRFPPNRAIQLIGRR